MDAQHLQARLTLLKWSGVKSANIGYIGQTKKDVLATCTIFAQTEMIFVLTENGKAVRNDEKTQMQRQEYQMLYEL